MKAKEWNLHSLMKHKKGFYEEYKNPVFLSIHKGTQEIQRQLGI